VSEIHPVYLIKGDDAGLTGQAVSSLLGDLLGERSADLAVEDVNEEADITAVLDACQTPAFLTDRRIVLVRSAGRFRADEVEPLIAYLDQPMSTTTLVLVGGGGAVPTRLMKAIKNTGHVIDAGVPGGKGRQMWINDRIKQGPVRLDRRAQELVIDRLGEELGQLTGVLDALAAAYGEGATVDVEQVEPFLGAGGVAAPWELTDAIDAGDTDTALAQLHRMLLQRHPLAIMATLQRHFGALLRLDGSGITAEAEAASVLGMSPYPAKKVLAQSRKLGSTNIARGLQLIARADVDLRGGSSWPPEMVIELLVARLAKLTPRARRSTGGARAVARR
jgi:DNA polymerase III subunit delta